LKRIDRIEFTISSFVGGKGTLWIDDLKFEPLQPETQLYPVTIRHSLVIINNHPPDFIIDNSNETFWQSSEVKDQEACF